MDIYYKISGERLIEIANAIREKTGDTAKLTLDEMIEAIRGISGGSGSGSMTLSGALLSPGYIVMDSMSLSVELEEQEET